MTNQNLALESKTNKATLILNIIKAALLTLSLLFLAVISSTATIASELYAVSGGKRYNVETTYDRIRGNFFHRMSYLNDEGFTPVLETIFLVLLISTIIIAILSCIPKLKALNKPYFLALSLATVALCVTVMIDGDCSHHLDITGPVYFEGLKVYLETSIRFYIGELMLATLIACSLALALDIIVKIILPLAKNKKNIPMQANAVSPVTPTKMTEPASPPHTAFSGSVPEELKKYKDLLDAGIITPEEFEAKKKELLSL